MLSNIQGSLLIKICIDNVGKIFNFSGHVRASSDTPTVGATEKTERYSAYASVRM